MRTALQFGIPASAVRRPLYTLQLTAGLFLAAAVLPAAAATASGNLTVPDGSTLAMRGPSGEHIVVSAADTPVALPAGEYVVNEWTCERKDEDGNSWKLQLFPRRDSFAIGVAEGQAPVLGKPSAIVSTLKIQPQQAKTIFWHSMKGERGEAVKLSCNGRRPPAPKLIVKNTAGTYEKTIRFGYG